MAELHGFVRKTAPLTDAPIRPALCRKNADPFAWFCVSFSTCKISSLDKQISTLKHFFSKSVYGNFKFSLSKRSGIVGILLLLGHKLARVRLDEA